MRCVNRHAGCVVVQLEKHVPATAKDAIDFEVFTARLKPRPFQNRFKLTHYQKPASTAVLFHCQRNVHAPGAVTLAGNPETEKASDELKPPKAVVVSF